MSSKTFRRIFASSLVAGLAIAVILIGYSLIFANRFESTGEDFLAKIANAEYNEAYELGSPRFKAATTLESWLDVSQKMNVRLSAAEVQLIASVSEEDKTLLTYEVASNNLIYDFLVHVSLEEGDYFIDYASYNLRKAGDGQNTSLQGVSP